MQKQGVGLSKRGLLLIAAAVVSLYVTLAAGSALAERPNIDEGFFANPAVTLLRKGFMGTTTIETAGTNVGSISRHTYWVMPLHLVLQAGWYKVFGFSLLKMRTLSVLWGLLALAAWFAIMRALTDDVKLALLACALVSLDYLFVTIASTGRMDIMSAALGFGAYALYLNLRERRLMAAILASQTLAVASGLTHPNGGLLAFTGLLFLTLYFDRARLSLKHVAVALVPYLVGAVGWGLYIAQEPSAFLPQFTNNATMNGRMGGLSNPARALLGEFTDRYPQAFGLSSHSAGHSGPIYLKALILAAYVLAVASAVLVRSLRRRTATRVLLILLALYFVVLAIFDGQKLSYNLVYIMPLYAALLAVFVHWCWTNRIVPRALVVVCLCGFFLLQTGGVLYRIRNGTYRNGYEPAINYLRQHGNGTYNVIGSSSLGFGLDFPDTLIDDIKLGYYSGKRPDFIVIDPDYAVTLDASRDREPDVTRYITRLLTDDYRMVHEQGGYRIYARR